MWQMTWITLKSDETCSWDLSWPIFDVKPKFEIAVLPMWSVKGSLSFINWQTTVIFLTFGSLQILIDMTALHRAHSDEWVQMRPILHKSLQSTDILLIVCKFAQTGDNIDLVTNLVTKGGKNSVLFSLLFFFSSSSTTSDCRFTSCGSLKSVPASKYTLQWLWRKQAFENFVISPYHCTIRQQINVVYLETNLIALYRSFISFSSPHGDPVLLR